MFRQVPRAFSTHAETKHEGGNPQPPSWVKLQDDAKMVALVRPSTRSTRSRGPGDITPPPLSSTLLSPLASRLSPHPSGPSATLLDMDKS